MEKEAGERIKTLRELKSKAYLAGGKEKIAKLHNKGKLTARERIERLVDPGSFVELNLLAGHELGAPTDGIIAGYGTIDGRHVCLYSQDSTVLGGSIGPIHGFKLYCTVERALEMQVPFIGLLDSPGARTERLGEIRWRVGDKQGGSVFFPNTQASGVIPQISLVLGSCAGISVYSPALTDFIFMVDGISHMFITGPQMVKSVMGEDISMEELGGAAMHCKVSGVADFRMKTEDECFHEVKRLLSFLPSNNCQSPPLVDAGDDPDRLDNSIADFVPINPNKAFDMYKVIARLVDNEDFMEVKREFAPEIIVGFGRLGGQTVGVVANQPMVRAGSLTVDSSDKQARFIRFCDAFNIPIVLLVDTPAYMPGSHQERAGIIRHGAKVLYALCEATVPRCAVVLRKVYGGGQLGMGTLPGMQTDFVFYWPIAETGVLGAEQSVELFYSNEIKSAPDPAKTKEEKVKEYREKYASPFTTASQDPFITDIIEPGETRRCLIKAFKLMQGKKKVNKYPKKHGNIPL